MTINPDLAQRIQDELGQNVYLCYQCVKCTSGCPVGEFFDWQPNQIMRALQLGQEDIALHSQTPWLCASCQTCTTRCPQGLDITAIMEFLTREALRPRHQAADPAGEHLQRGLHARGAPVGPVLRAGPDGGDEAAHIAICSAIWTWASSMLQKNKLPSCPSPTRPPRNAKPVPGAASTVAYYPGCSLHSTAPEFNHSAEAVCAGAGA